MEKLYKIGPIFLDEQLIWTLFIDTCLGFLLLFFVVVFVFVFVELN